MNTSAPTRPAALHRHCVLLTARAAAAAEARGRVRAAICTWDVRVDTDTAVLLTSELVTNAITQESGETISLTIECNRDGLRVEVHDTSAALPVQVSAEVDAETGRGLVLVDTLSDEWGWYHTPSGKAVFFRLGNC